MGYANTLPKYLTPAEWLDHVFSSQAAMRGGVVRRKVRDVERLVGRALFRDELGSGPTKPTLSIHQILWLTRFKAAGIVVLFQGIELTSGAKSDEPGGHREMHDLSNVLPLP